MTGRPVAALTSELLVRKGMARPLGLELAERTPDDVAQAVRPSIASAKPRLRALPPAAPFVRAIRPRGAVARMLEACTAILSRWGLPTVLLVAGLTMVTAVVVTGSGPAPAGAAAIAAPTSRPHGPTPVTWIDNGLMANPALAGR